MEDLLADTYGLMIYQESVMRVAQRFAGYTLAEADNLRKACAKKIRELMVKEREKFVDGCTTTGYGAEVGTKLFDIIEPFADYAFPKSHSYGYGLVAYQTAWLKVHHPVEYLAALLTSVKASQDKAGVYLAECRQMDIKVLVPDVNVSSLDFTALGAEEAPAGLSLPVGCVGLIPFGLSAVRNVGEGLVASDPRGARQGRAVHRLLRLLRTGRSDRAQQAGHRVIGQGRRRSTPSAIPAGGCSWSASRSST